MGTTVVRTRDDVLAPGGAPADAEGRAAGETRYPNEQHWRRIFVDGYPKLHHYRRVAGWLPSPPRCNVCRVPFGGPGAALMRLRGCIQSHRNANYCNRCELAIRTRPGATNVELSIVFADVRGSTAYAEQAEHGGNRASYVRRLRRFEAAVKSVFDRTTGFIIDVVGDEVVGIYPPGLSGQHHAALAIRAAQELVRVGIGESEGEDTMLPFGVGVHTGEVFLGNRSSEGEQPTEDELSKVRIIGDHVNVAARLASAAARGEALVSDATAAAGGAALPAAERREIAVGGRSEPVRVHVLRGA